MQIAAQPWWAITAFSHASSSNMQFQFFLPCAFYLYFPNYTTTNSKFPYLIIVDQFYTGGKENSCIAMITFFFNT